MNFMDEVADHLTLLALTENLDRGVALFERHFPWIQQSRDPYDQFQILLAAWLLFDVLSAHKTEKVLVKLPESFGSP